MARILIVEDEPDIALGLEEDFRLHGFETEVAPDGEMALRRATESGWDVILLDVMLPIRDGFDVCRELRRRRVRTPVLMLTARTQDVEKILGLELGADDYVTKPFHPGELLARVRALLRRATPDDRAGTYTFGDCVVDFDRGELRRDGQPVDLTALEFRLLACFIDRRGRVLSRARLIEEAWSDGVHIGDRVVDTHVLRLRKKVEPVPARPRFIRSVRGMGYRFDG